MFLLPIGLSVSLKLGVVPTTSRCSMNETKKNATPIKSLTAL